MLIFKHILAPKLYHKCTENSNENLRTVSSIFTGGGIPGLVFISHQLGWESISKLECVMSILATRALFLQVVLEALS